MQKLLRFIFSFTLIILTTHCSKHTYESTFEYEPSTPAAGDEVTVYYNPAETKLKDADSIELIAYNFNDKLLETTGVTLIKDENGFYGKIKINPQAVGVLIKFVSEKPSLTDNNKQGYFIPVNEKEADAGYASALGSWIYILDVDPDYQQSIEKFEKSFTSSPGLLGKYADNYFNSLWRGNTENRDSVINKNLAELEQGSQDDEKILTTLVKWYSRLGNTEKADQYKPSLNKKYPLNEIAENEEFQKIREETDLQKKLAMADNFVNTFKESERKQDLFYYVLEDFRKQDKIAEALEIINKNPRQPNPYIFTKLFNQANEKNDTSALLKITAVEVEVTKAELEKPEGAQPKSITVKEWEKARRNEYGYALYHLAQVEYKTSDKSTALASAKKAAEFTGGEDVDVNFYYVKLLNENGKNTEAIDKIKEFIADGKANNEIKEILKSLYIPAIGNLESYEALMKELENKALVGLIKKLKTEIINEPAPGFTLKNLDGKQVSLADFKGKTVIIDFWATWCGPCLQSFPGMQMAVEKFEDNNSVVFLFVNTWERVEDKLTNAKDFIKNNKYPFNVLMDTENSVVAAYKVAGIPTKFIVDGNGNIRFKIVGFDGNTDRVADEISAMVNLATE